MDFEARPRVREDAAGGHKGNRLGGGVGWGGVWDGSVHAVAGLPPQLGNVHM